MLFIIKLCQILEKMFQPGSENHYNAVLAVCGTVKENTKYLIYRNVILTFTVVIKQVHTTLLMKYTILLCTLNKYRSMETGLHVLPLPLVQGVRGHVVNMQELT